VTSFMFRQWFVLCVVCVLRTLCGYDLFNRKLTKAAQHSAQEFRRPDCFLPICCEYLILPPTLCSQLASEWHN
jgi:hypothetical protein